MAAATMANLVTQTYYRQNLASARGENTIVKDFLWEQLDIVAGELRGLKMRLPASRRRRA